MAPTRKRPKRKTRPRCKVSRRRKPRAKRSSQAGYDFDPQVESSARRKKRTKRADRCKPRKRKRRPRRPVAQPTPPPPSPPPAPVRYPSPIALYTGPFGRAQAERLLWRAGFGPSPGWPEALAAMGVDAAVESLVSPQGPELFTGAEPRTSPTGAALEPEDLFGHDHLYWLDRMVRTNQPFVQRMALIWHDWFATSNNEVENQRLMLDQYELFVRAGRGSFEQLVREVTMDPAMCVFLNTTENRRGAINENYGRELMELFTLGADRGAYTETEVRELARSLSGWTRSYTDGIGYHSFRFDPNRWDTGNKTVFGQTGHFNWEDAYRMCVHHPLHASFFVAKLWSYFVAVPLPADEAARLATFYVQSGRQVLPVVRAILRHPLLYEGPRMIKPPVVFNAGLLRAVRRAIDTTEWVNLSDISGQRLFYPPDVSGWNDTRWLDTSTIRGRWQMVSRVLSDRYVAGASQSTYDRTEVPETALQKAVDFWAGPTLTAESRASLLGFSQTCFTEPSSQTQKSQYRAYRQNALMQLIGVSPDLQTG